MHNMFVVCGEVMKRRQTIYVTLITACKVVWIFMCAAESVSDSRIPGSSRPNDNRYCCSCPISVLFRCVFQATAAEAGRRNATFSAPWGPGSTDPNSGPSRSTPANTTSTTATCMVCRRDRRGRYRRTAPETRPNRPLVSEIHNFV